MLFNSYAFIFAFFPSVFAIHYLLRRAGNAVLPSPFLPLLHSASMLGGTRSMFS